LLNENAFLPERFIFKGEDVLNWLRKEIKEMKAEQKLKNQPEAERETLMADIKEQKMSRANRDLRVSKESR